jgi:aspartate aminotransferase/aminotransferase
MLIAQRHDLAVVSDEVYEDVVFDREHVSIGSLDATRVVSVFSFSKGYAMTGWRIGYAVGSKELVEAMVKVQEAVVACPSFIAQKAAEAALTGPQEPVRRMREAYRERRNAAVLALRDHQLFVSEPRGAFYILADVAGLGTETYEIARRLLVEERVAVAPGETFGPAGAGMIRLSLASGAEVVSEAIGRIARVLNRGGREVDSGS